MAQVVDTRSLGAKGADVAAQLAVCLPLGVALTVIFGTAYRGSVASPSDALTVLLLCTGVSWLGAMCLSGAASSREPFTAAQLARVIYVRGPAWTAAGALWLATWALLLAGGFALGVLFIRVLRGAI